MVKFMMLDGGGHEAFDFYWVTMMMDFLVDDG